MSDLRTILTLGATDNDSDSLRLTLQRTFQNSFEGSVWQERFDNAQLAAKFRRTGDSLATRLGNVLTQFRNSLDSFQWPKSNPLFNGRLIVGNEDFAEHVSAVVSKEGEAVRYYKYFSRGLNEESDTNLSAGEYKFELTLGDDTEEFSIDVESDWKNGDLIDAVADAINGSTLQVQAEVVSQLTPKLRVPDLNATGTALLLAVNAGSEDQDLSLAETKGHLLDEFEFSSVNVPTEPASLNYYQLFSGKEGKPTQFFSDTFDPNATPTLNEGVYSFDWSMGEQSGSIEFSVTEDDTWETLLNRVAGAVEGSQTMFSAEVVERPLLSDKVEDQLLYIDGVALKFEANSPKLGERLSITGGIHMGDGTFSINTDLSDNYIQLTQDQYDAVGTGTPFTVSSDGTLPSPLAADTTYYVIKSDEERLIQLALSEADALAGNAVTITDSGSGTHSIQFTTGYPLDELNMKTAQPGADTSVTTEGKTYTRAAGPITLDQGRVHVEIEESFAGVIPMSVVEPLQVMQDRLSDVVTSYNDLRSLLVGNLDLLREDTSEIWREAVTDNAAALEGIGLQETGADKTLWFSHDDFYRSLGADAEATKSLLLDEEDGLLTRWSEETQTVFNAGVSSLIINEASITDPIYGKPGPRTELELERGNQLLDLYDSAAEDFESMLDADPGTGLVSKKG